jgi:antitoxin CptB
MDGNLQTPESPLNEDVERRKVRWRCRRGMRELDDLLLRWLEREWTAASEARRGVFLRLLDCEDDRLWRWFLGKETAPDAALDALVQHIRTLPP